MKSLGFAKLMALMAAVLMLAVSLPLCASAEESLPYMQQLSQTQYINVSLLTTDSYPEVCIMPYYFSSAFISQYKAPYFMHFPCPGNTFAADFNEYSATFLDMEYYRQYTYIAQESYAYETFLNNCDVDEYIIADGTGGVAIYIEPDSYRARALIGVSGIEKSTKLEIRFTDSSLKNKSAQQVVELLTEQISAEVARIQASLTVELADHYWTEGRYAGFSVMNLTRNTENISLTYTLPEGYYVTKVDNSDVSIATVRGERDALVASFDMETYSYVNSRLEEEPEHVMTATFDDVEYRIYYHWYNEKILSAKVDRVLSTTAGYSGDDTLYLTIDLDPEGDYEWTSIEAMEADLATIVSGIQISVGESVTDYHDATPYAAAAVTAAQEAPAASEGWVCPACGETVTSNFCPNDGTAKPEDENWVCPECGETVTTNFCPNDGTAKPAEDAA
ncbi:MAG: zinc ribbon domain-containing protein [Christensenellaceae bacterium]|nr:zinc ribbon domain-containing protein [Christensenellaceae bacterium]